MNVRPSIIANPEFGAGVVVSFFAAITSFFLCWGLGGEHAISVFIMSLSVGVWTSSLIVSVKYEKSGYFSLFVCLYFLFMYSIPGMVHASSGVFPFYRMDYTENTVILSSAISLIFSVAYFFGLISCERNGSNIPRTEFLDIDKSKIFFVSLMFLSIALFIVAIKGVGVFMSERGALRSFDLNDIVLMGTARISIFLSLVSFVKFSSLNKFNYFSLFFIVISGACFIIINSPLAIPRFTFFSYIIVFFISFGLFYDVVYKRIIALIFPILSVTVFPIASHMARGERGVDWWNYDILEYYTSSGDFDGFQSVINTIEWVNAEGLQWGRQLISAALGIVPRAFWSDKGLPTGQASAIYQGYEFTNISCPLPGEFYSDFGILGVILGGYLWGYFASFVDGLAGRALLSKRFPMLLVMSTIAAYAVIVCRGSLLAVITMVMLAVILSSAIFLTEKKVRPPHLR